MTREPQGRFLGVPFDWKRPTGRDLARGSWDPGDERIVEPKNYGWGWDVNLHAVGKRLRRR